MSDLKTPSPAQQPRHRRWHWIVAALLITGTRVGLTGQYSLDGKLFDFHGKARLDAKLSQMVTGWKRILLTPADPFFSESGAGTELPVRITGTESEPHFGLNFHHKDRRAE